MLDKCLEKQNISSLVVCIDNAFLNDMWNQMSEQFVCLCLYKEILKSIALSTLQIEEWG